MSDGTDNVWCNTEQKPKILSKQKQRLWDCIILTWMGWHMNNLEFKWLNNYNWKGVTDTMMKTGFKSKTKYQQSLRSQRGLKMVLAPFQLQLKINEIYSLAHFFNKFSHWILMTN